MHALERDGQLQALAGGSSTERERFGPVLGYRSAASRDQIGAMDCRLAGGIEGQSPEPTVITVTFQRRADEGICWQSCKRSASKSSSRTKSFLRLGPMCSSC